MQELLDSIIQDEILHAKWLNTLSYLENCGARKIAACEHPLLVKKEMLKHAAEEFRHAHYLKQQISRITKQTLHDYSVDHLLGGVYTKNYLHALDIWTCRYLRTQGAFSIDLAYHLVTYGIEVRAEKFYALYHTSLRFHRSKVTVKSIILEEIGHLKEMKKGLSGVPKGLEYAQAVCCQEEKLFQNWQSAIKKQIK